MMASLVDRQDLPRHVTRPVVPITMSLGSGEVAFNLADTGR